MAYVIFFLILLSLKNGTEDRPNYRKESNQTQPYILTVRRYNARDHNPSLNYKVIQETFAKTK